MLNLEGGFDFFGAKSHRNKKQLAQAKSNAINNQNQALTDFKDFYAKLSGNRTGAIKEQLGSIYDNT